jgi:glycosyltransferase involved in cell wall biosynthesis
MAISTSDSCRSPNAQPEVSVVMSMHNAAATIEQAIRSLQWQTLTDWELILIDDGSSDDSIQIVAAMGERRINIQSDGKRLGLAARLNQGVGLARGRFIARMDADDVCFPERLAKQVAHLRDHQNVDVVASCAAVFSEAGDLIGIMQAGRDRQTIGADPFRGFPFPHPTWCGRADWFRRHPYNASLRRAQDQELLLRCYSQSSLAGMPEVLLGYRQERFDIRKILHGRFVYARAIWRYGRALRPFQMVLRGICMQAVKAIVDIVMLGLGLNRFSQRLRVTPVPEAVRKTWIPLWAALQSCAERQSHPASAVGAEIVQDKR